MERCKRPDLSLTHRRAAGAALAGALIGAGLTTIGIAGPIAIESGPGGGLDAALGLEFYVFVVALVIWMLGILITGVPLWIWAHHRQFRSPTAAALIGAALPFTFLIAITLAGDLMPDGLETSSADGVDYVVNGHHTLAGWLQTIGFAGLLGLAGVAVALTIWRVAYRKHTP